MIYHKAKGELVGKNPDPLNADSLVIRIKTPDGEKLINVPNGNLSSKSEKVEIKYFKGLTADFVNLILSVIGRSLVPKELPQGYKN